MINALLQKIKSVFVRDAGQKNPVAFLKKRLRHRCIFQLKLPQGFGLVDHLNFRPLAINRKHIVLQAMRHPFEQEKMAALGELEFIVFILESQAGKSLTVHFHSNLVEVVSDTTIKIAMPEGFDSISSNKKDRLCLEHRHQPAISLWGIDKKCANIRLLKMFNPLILYLPHAGETERMLVDISPSGLCLSLSRNTYSAYSGLFKTNKDILLQLLFRNPDMIQKHEFVLIATIRYLRPNTKTGRMEIGVQFANFFQREPKPEWVVCKKDGIPELEWLLNQYRDSYLAEIKNKLSELYQAEMFFDDNLAAVDAAKTSEYLNQERLAVMNRAAFGVCSNVVPVLSNINMTLQYLLSKNVDPLEQRLLQNAVNQMNLVSIKLENIYEFTSLESTRHELVDVAALMRSVVSKFKDFSERNRIAVDVSGDASPPQVYGDAHQLTLVFNNLVLNAMEAMKPLGGRLGVAVKWDADQHQLLVSVADTGEGVPSEVRDSIFEPYRTDRQQAAGLGLGLAVVQRIVAGHGGHIDIQSTLGEGATFTVRLPCPSEVVEAFSGERLQ